MDISFYTAAVAAKAQQSKLDVIGNNIANVNTTAYKAQNAAFVDLLYNNMREPATTETQLKVGSGIRMDKTDINFNSGGLKPTDNPTDYTIIGSGFFAVKDPETNEIYYTRDGSFQHSLRNDGEFYLTTSNGDLVLDKNFEKINIESIGKDVEEDGQKPAVFEFEIEDGLLLKGNNLFSPTLKNGEPILNEDAKVETGFLELSNVEISGEMTKIIEAQRAYSMVLKMVQTSNEVEEIINNLR